MDDFGTLESHTLTQKPRWAARLGNLMEVLLVAVGGFIVVPIILALIGIGPERLLQNSGYLFVLLTSEASLTLLLILFLLAMRKQTLTNLGWGRGNLLREASIGVMILPLLFLSTFLISFLFHSFFPHHVTERNPLLELVRTPGDLTLLLISSLYVGGLKEELQRAFVIERFRENLGGATLGVILWSLFFGYGHMIQGVDNAVGAGVLGLTFGLLYLWRKSVTAPIVAHALYDVVTLVAYWSFYRETADHFNRPLGGLLFGFLF
jgi:membrane protease YdiL (CAAX protease family)